MEPAIPNGTATETQEPAELPIREQDRLMPIANVIRIMRRVLPPHAKISDDAKELIQECVSEFISFVTGEANDRCHGEHRKTVTADDLVWAMERLGFDDYVTPLSVYLRRMRESEGGGRGPGARADLAGPRASLAPPVAALHHVQVQRDQAMYAPPPAPTLAYTVAMPGVTANSPHLNGQYEVFGGERSMAAYYGGAYGAGTSQGHHDDEASSSNATPAPTLALGDGSQ